MLTPKNPFSPVYTLHVLGRPLPFGTDPHTGASKAYIFLPFFSFFGPSVAMQRSMTLLMGDLALVFCYFFMVRVAGVWPAFWALLFLSLDSSFIFYSKLDAGPIIEKLMWMMFCLWSFSEWGKSQKYGYLLLGFLGATAGMYGHIAFVWFIAAAVLSCSLLFRKEIRRFVGRRELTLMSLAFIVILTFFLYWLVGARDLLKLRILNIGGTLGILEQLATRGGIISDVLGEFLNGWIKTRPLTDLFCGASILFLVCYFRSRPVLFFLTLSSFLFLQMSFTPGDIPSHRIMMLYVFLLLLGGIAITESLRNLRMRGSLLRIKRLFSGAIVFLGIVSLVGQATFIKEAIYAIRETGGTGRWSDAVYSLADYLKEKKWDKVVCIDWGFRKNLFLLTRGEILLEEPFWHWEDEQKMEEELTRMSRSSTGVLFLLHPDPYWVRKFPTVRRFEKIIERAGAKAVLRKTFFEKSGKPVYLAYTVETGN
jgi:hypothetical protein